MTEYCTIDDMTLRFGESELASITDRSNADNPIVDDDIVNQAIKDASGKMDAELLMRFEQPKKPFSTVLNLICCDIARWLLYEDSLDEENIIQRRYERALSLLSNIASGTLYVVGLVEKTPDRVRIIRA